MDCASVDAVLNEHRVAGLGRAERQAIDDHVRTCSRCAEAWCAHEVLAAEPGAEVPAGLFERVTEALGQRPPAPVRASRLGRTPIWLGLGAAAAAAIAVAVLYAPFERADAPVAEPVAQASVLPVTPSPAFVEGEHYTRVALPLPPVGPINTVEVAEFFMYGCPHCYAFEGFFGPWCEARAEAVDVVRVPVMFNSLARLHARAYYTAEALGMEEELHHEFFAEFHDRGGRLDSEPALQAFFARFGVEPTIFRLAFGSEYVREKMLQAEELNRRYGIRGTPSLVINREFMATPALAGSFETMLMIADRLVKQAIAGSNGDLDDADVRDEPCCARDREPGRTERQRRIP